MLMRPPICDVCDREFDPDREGGLLYFKETIEGRAFDKRVDEEGITGHPPDAGWFCGRHYKKARKLLDLTIDEALKELR